MPVLVIDDSRTMARLARNLLMLIGFSDVDDVFDGATALARVHERQYGLVLCDWNMRPMTGHMLLQRIRAYPSLERLPVIVLTAETTLDNVMAAKEAGANGISSSRSTGRPSSRRSPRCWAQSPKKLEGPQFAPCHQQFKCLVDRDLE
jgi:two-component system chemotaxis response regulator CheY